MDSSEPDALPDPEVLNQLGECFATGLYEQPEALPLVRYARLSPVV